MLRRGRNGKWVPNVAIIARSDSITETKAITIALEAGGYIA
jgi:hypothetical protein